MVVSGCSISSRIVRAISGYLITSVKLNLMLLIIRCVIPSFPKAVRFL